MFTVLKQNAEELRNFHLPGKPSVDKFSEQKNYFAILVYRDHQRPVPRHFKKTPKKTTHKNPQE